MNLSFAEPCEQYPVYWHATIGAYMTQKTCNIHDVTVFTAIATHSYEGRATIVVNVNVQDADDIVTVTATFVWFIQKIA